jgi:hypothetical protein
MLKLWRRYTDERGTTTAPQKGNATMPRPKKTDVARMQSALSFLIAQALANMGDIQKAARSHVTKAYKHASGVQYRAQRFPGDEDLQLLKVAHSVAIECGFDEIATELADALEIIDR